MAETTRASVEEQIGSFAEGDLEYAKDMLSALWDIASKDGGATAPSNAPSGVSSLQSPPSSLLRSTSLLGPTGFESCSLGLC